VLITGDKGFLHRYQSLFTEISSYCETLNYLPDNSPYAAGTSKKALKILYGLLYLISSKRNLLAFSEVRGFRLDAKVFAARSRKTERLIRSLSDRPDLIFHVFCMYSPLWKSFDIPYVMYLDYTTALAKQRWFPWAPFQTEEAYSERIKCERLAYENATFIFTMSNLAKSSLITDYGIEPRKIVVVGSSGHLVELYSGEKQFGSKQILFQSSDFERKGGDLVLTAFRKVRAVLPEATLVIIGKKLNISEVGVSNLGYVSSSSEMRNLFLETDLVVAPSRCEPFQAFLLEAMNYGVPCIASDSDGTPEIIDNRIDGVLIHQPTADSLAAEIINLLCDPSALESMSEKARLKVKDKFNWNAIAKKIVAVLKN